MRRPRPLKTASHVATSELVLDATGLEKRFRNKVAVAGIDLAIASGERVGLLGPNGAGKTTTLLMLLGVIRPDQGSVQLAGYALPRQRARAMNEVGFAAGYLPLAERLKVKEFLGIYGQLYNITDPSEAIRAGLERFGIVDLANKLGTELSSGQRTLVGIVKATLHRPRLLVLDEPTASLDPDVAQRVRRGLLEMSETDGTALLVTSHDMVEVERLCERIVFISRGHVVADGTPVQVVERFGRGDLEELFLHLAAEATTASLHIESDQS